MVVERLSIELSDRCDKGCAFCYNGSNPQGQQGWHIEEVVGFVRDCARQGTRAVSFGGGEPLQAEGLEAILRQLDGVVYRSLTTNGLLLRGERLERLVAARPDKVHVSVHYPDRRREVERVIEQVTMLAGRGIASGVNLLVERSKLEAATRAAHDLRQAGIDNARIVYLPMRGRDTPTPREMAEVAGATQFQSMSCLLSCGASPRFCSISHDKHVAWCSYTVARRKLEELSARGLQRALSGLGLVFCGDSEASDNLRARAKEHAS